MDIRKLNDFLKVTELVNYSLLAGKGTRLIERSQDSEPLATKVESKNQVDLIQDNKKWWGLQQTRHYKLHLVIMKFKFIATSRQDLVGCQFELLD